MLEKFLQNYFTSIGAFAWDKAREMTEKNKQFICSHSPQFHSLLITLYQNERAYFSLEFLEQKWFLKKDQLRNSYSHTQASFLAIKLPDVTSTEAKEQQNMIRMTSSHLAEFCSLRSQSIAIYQNLSKAGMSSSYERICISIKLLLDLISKKLHGKMYESIKINLYDELNLLHSLLEASSSISSWEFAKASYALQRSHTVLVKWKPIFTNKNSGTFRSSIFSFGEKVSNPSSALYNWLEKMFKFLNSKSTFYFYESFSQSLTVDEMKQTLSKMSYDFVSKSLAFMKKYDGNYLRLYLSNRLVDDTGEVAQIRHGYVIPPSSMYDENSYAFTGNLKFSSVLTLPQTIVQDEVTDQEILSKAVSSQGHTHEKANVHILPDGKNTIFCALVDKNMSLVVSMKGVRTEKDTNVQSYFNDTLQQLRPRRIALIR